MEFDKGFANSKIFAKQGMLLNLGIWLQNFKNISLRD